MDSLNRSAVTFAARSVVEHLEQRTLLASISGTLFEDLNNNGQREGREKPLIGVTVFLETIENAQGQTFKPNGKIDPGEPVTVTDVNGYYEFTNVPIGKYVVRQIYPNNKYGQTFPGINGSSVGGGDYNLVIRFPDASLGTNIRSIFESAAARWEQILIGDLTEQFTDIGIVDDMVIDARGAAIDGRFGTLAFAGPTQLRPAGDPNEFLPVRGEMTFDLADIDDPGLYETILHEMGHALGFVSNIWQSKNLAVGLGLAAPRFLGTNAIREYNRIFNGTIDPQDPNYDPSGVPLEGNISPPGSRDSHWRESVFRTELMTPFSEGADIGEPISTVTIGLFEDIGYTVQYQAADDYDPNNLFPAPTSPGLANFGQFPFGHTVSIRADDEVIQGRDFANRINTPPNLDSLKTRQALFLAGEMIKLQAFGASDIDPGDSIIAVNFYMETNGIPGLQTGAGGDMFLAQDRTLAGGYRTVIDTGPNGLDLSPGEYTFYARSYDELGFTSTVRSTSFSLLAPMAPPARPVNLATVATSSSTIEVTWTDKAVDEFGYRLERSTDFNFGGKVQRFTLPANTTSFTDTGLAPSTRYYYRVRAFNIGMTDDAGVRTQFSRASSPGGATTLSRGEVVVDSAAGADVISTDGPVTTIAVPGAVGGSVLRIGPGGVVRFAPPLAVGGDYFVYGKWQQINGSGQNATFTVTDSRRVVQSQTIDQSRRGRDNSEVLIGKFNFVAGNRTVVVITPTGATDVVTIDQLRFKPAFAVSPAALAAASSRFRPPGTGLSGDILG